MKLSDKQRELIRLMQRDWILRRELQKDSPTLVSPKGYAKKKIHFATAYSLIKKRLLTFRLIRGSYSASFIEYSLTTIERAIHLTEQL